jgi:surface protein
MSFMFNGATRFNQPLGNWDTGNVAYMSYMFCRALQFDQPISNWDMRSVQRMNGMFVHAIAFNQSLSEWHAVAAENYNNPTIFHRPNMFEDAPWMLRLYPDGIITRAKKSPLELWSTVRRRVQERRETRRFRWQMMCDASTLHVDEIRALATAAHIQDAAAMPKRTLCAALSRRWDEQKAEQVRLVPNCHNTVDMLQTPVQDIAPEFFYSYEQDGLRYCDDIRTLHEYVQRTPAISPYSREPYDDETIDGIRTAYAHLHASAVHMRDYEDDVPMVVPFQTQLTQKLVELMSKLHYPNDIEPFRNASRVKFFVFVDALQQNGVFSPNDRVRLNEQADLDQQKAFLVDLLRMKIAQDPEQAQTTHGPISRIAHEVTSVYNDLFIY